MNKYAVFAIFISITLCACQKNQQQEIQNHRQQRLPSEPTSTIAETAAPKDISAYEDLTAVIPDSTKRLVENPIFIFSLIPDADSRLGVSQDELYQNSVSVVRGTITDHTYQSEGMIYDSFAVSEV